EIIPGSGNFVGAGPPRHVVSTAVSDDGGITLNFVNADVRDVAKAVLGDFLGLNYTIGAGVQGTVTMQTSRPVGRTEVLPVLEQSLRLNGLALVKTGDIYKVVPLTDAPRQSGTITTAGSRHAHGEPGFGIEVVPLRFVSAVEMQHLIEPLVPSQAIVHADTARNFLIIEGTEDERAAIVDEVGVFDVDWLSGMSFALFAPKYTDARGLAKELDEILGGAGSPLAGVVRLVPIERLNSVLAISTQPRYLQQLQHWVDRLDRPGEGTDRRIYVYAVQYGRAADIAEVLTHVLFGGATPSPGTKSGAGSSTSAPAGEGFSLSTMGEPAPGSPGTGSPTATPGGGASDSSEPLLSKSLEEAASETAGTTGNATITADPTNNSLVIYGTSQQYAVIESALHQLDIVPLQVLLEASIAEVTLTHDLQYGVQYFYNPGNKQNTITLSNAGFPLAQAFPGFSYMFTQGTNIQIILNALSTVTHVEVISSPEVMVLNNHTATLQVGDQVPIATATAVGVTTPDSPIVNSIEYHDTGVILKVTPGVNQGGMVTMDISQEVSNVAADSTSTLGSPTFAQRKIESTISIQDGETIALGGLISDSKTFGNSGLPFLSEIPVVGGLFGSKNDDHDRTELMVLITPHVIDDLQRARSVTDELRHKMPSVEPLFHRRK
ncbi:MAG TPA: type II secretion system secretin GspD, partial [Rhizomicrobium sp.]|nr:type II secretion system secretin GspD [Rhizomicrobium sp.]